MKPFLSRIVVIATALLGALAVAPADAAPPEGTLTVAVATFGNERWLPNLYVGAEDVVLKPLWENLLSRDGKGNLIPMLAERWEVLDGGRTWKFHLRKGVRFHNGSEVTAEDVKFTFASIAREGSANSLSPEFRLIKSMEVEGPHTISVRFDKPFVTFGNRVTHGLFASVAYIQSRKHIETAGEQGAERQPVGTGPWKFVEHVRGDRIVYEAVENHWRATPHWKRLVFVKVPEPATRMAMLRAGGADVIEIGGEYVDELKKVGMRMITMPNTAAIWVILGGQWPTKPTYDPKVPWAQPDAERARKVRLALNLAVDKKAIIDRVLGGVGTPVGTVNYYPTDPWITESLLKPVPYDPTKAKALLAEAGYPNGFEITMNLTAWPGRGFLPDVGEAVATYWEKVGLKVKRRPVDRAVFSADFRARSYAGGGPGLCRAHHRPGALGAVRAHRPDEVGRASAGGAPQAGCAHRAPGGRADRAGADADHARGTGALALRVHAGRQHRGDALDRRRGTEGGGMAVDPESHGDPQLGIRDAGRQVRSAPTPCGAISPAEYCKHC